jgi:hypothetical protein
LVFTEVGGPGGFPVGDVGGGLVTVAGPVDPALHPESLGVLSPGRRGAVGLLTRVDQTGSGFHHRDAEPSGALVGALTGGTEPHRDRPLVRHRR